MGDSSREGQGSDWSGKGGCREPGIGTAFAEISESWNSDSLRERGGRVSVTSEHPLMSAVKAIRRSVHRKDIGKNWIKYAQAGTATCNILKEKETTGTEREASFELDAAV